MPLALPVPVRKTFLSAILAVGAAVLPALARAAINGPICFEVTRAATGDTGTTFVRLHRDKALDISKYSTEVKIALFQEIMKLKDPTATVVADRTYTGRVKMSLFPDPLVIIGDDQFNLSDIRTLSLHNAVSLDVSLSPRKLAEAPMKVAITPWLPREEAVKAISQGNDEAAGVFNALADVEPSSQAFLVAHMNALGLRGVRLIKAFHDYAEGDARKLFDGIMREDPAIENIVPRISANRIRLSEIAGENVTLTQQYTLLSSDFPENSMAAVFYKMALVQADMEIQVVESNSSRVLRGHVKWVSRLGGHFVMGMADHPEAIDLRRITALRYMEEDNRNSVNLEKNWETIQKLGLFERGSFALADLKNPSYETYERFSEGLTSARNILISLVGMDGSASPRMPILSRLARMNIRGYQITVAYETYAGKDFQKLYDGIVSSDPALVAAVNEALPGFPFKAVVTEPETNVVGFPGSSSVKASNSRPSKSGNSNNLVTFPNSK